MPISVVGLTGGIGSGKSAAAERFAELGVTVVDADVISHQLTAVGGEAMAAIAEEFGPTALLPDGSMNRQSMRNMVFGQPERRARLEAILHPRIYAECQRQLLRATGGYAILVVPLLFENPLYLQSLSRTLVVDCDEAVQVARVMQRNGLSESMVRSIMAAQLSRRERCARADDIIDNSGSLEALRLQVDAKHRYYLGNLVKP
ncbi:dephospho-CoA kinase [Paludibacterium denitrificans]|uniref:Dephospho-CoA kinase n=1 Tax=Paludibacterium denitrificans TaxID=2675226 RepID=A0A844GFT3_9NEIS|nr:dephospho-CoA kinase [Paludibacterium denitrificans]MTD33385.1 dephospho-CoA kinase [Paludibacterium denitrificans]